MKQVCVLLVTYNRSKYLLALLNSLLKQIFKISGLVIVNNNSNDDTEQMLIKNGYISKTIKKDTVTTEIKEGIKVNYYSSSVNTGGAGGFNKAFDILLNLKQKYDLVWVMDDDVLPDENCLHELQKNISNEVELCIPNRNCKDFEDKPILRFNKSNPFLVFTQRKKILKKIENKNYYVQDMPFEGPLFTFDLIKKVGLPEKDYFIFYDDSDYCTRCLNYTKALYVTKAKLNKQIIPQKSNNKKMNWRNYYLYRNCILFDRKFGSNIFVKIFSPRLFILELYIKNILLLRFSNLKIIHLAARDGRKQITGKTIEPGSI